MAEALKQRLCFKLVLQELRVSEQNVFCKLGRGTNFFVMNAIDVPNVIFSVFEPLLPLKGKQKSQHIHYF